MKNLSSLVVAALISSLMAQIFVMSLNLSVDLFQTNGFFLVWFFPLAGLGLAKIMDWKYFKNNEANGSPARIGFLFATANWSHAFGASVGRESAAVQVGASSAEWLRRRIHNEQPFRYEFSVAAMAAAFTVVLAAPISGVLFALETSAWKKNRSQILSSIVGGGVGYFVLWLIPTNHWQAASVSFNFLELNPWSYLGLLLILWLVANIFYGLESQLTKSLKKLPSWFVLSASGLALGLATVWIGNTQFNNFSLPLLESAWQKPSEFGIGLTKLMFTLVSLISGWQGGAFVPLMVSGGLFGSWFAGLSGLPISAATGIGVFSIIHKKFKIPVTSAALTAELFGWKLGLLSIPLHLMLRYLRINKGFK